MAAPSRRPHRVARAVQIVLLAMVMGVISPLAIVSAQAPAGVAWATIDQSLGSLAPKSNLLVAEVHGSTCSTIHGRNAQAELAIASVFKLYVLGELARQVQLGEASWSDTIVISDSLRSMPSGDYAYVAAGTRVDVRSLAEAMIWVSDNTATDHLINYLGRDNVERAFAAFGHSDPTANAPLLLTRELFTIKMSQTAEWMSDYMQASNDEQARLVATTIGSRSVNPTGGWGNWNGPTAIDGIEWFASADDLCRATASLWAMGAQPGLEPIHAIMTGNRGGIADTTAFPLAGYKGGYEAGVVNSTYVLERADGRVFVVTAGYNTPRGAVEQSAGRTQLDQIFSCLAVPSGANACADSV